MNREKLKSTPWSKTTAVLFCFFAVLACCVFSSCNYRTEKLPRASDGRTVFPKPTRLPSFSELTSDQGVLRTKCLFCHDGAGRAHDLRAYPVFKSELALIRDSIVTRRMPKTPGPAEPLTDIEMGLLLAWIDAGAPELGDGSPEPTPTPPTSPTSSLSFASVKPVIDAKCIKCHDRTGTEHEDFDMNDYATVFRLRRRVEGRINKPETDKKRMPPITKPQLTPDEFQLLTDWLKAGAPQ